MSATNLYSTEAQLLQNTPKEFPNAAYAAGRLKRARNIVPLTAQEATSTTKLLPIPAGSVFAFGVLNSDTSLGSTTIQIGVSGSTAAYKADATFTSTNTPTMFGKTATVDDEPASTAAVEPLITWSTATAPASGTLVVDMYYSQAS